MQIDSLKTWGEICKQKPDMSFIPFKAAVQKLSSAGIKAKKKNCEPKKLSSRKCVQCVELCIVVI